jgi:hypothetical protein
VAVLTINEIVAQTRQVMDAVGSDRWSDDEIVASLNYVYDAEWGRLLSAAPYYRFNKLTITPNNDGTFPLSSLSSGSGNNQKNFFRVLSINDGNVQYSETRFQDIPLATSSSYMPYLRKMFYLAGENYQVLPAASTTLTVVVNYKPTSIRDYVNDGVIDKWDIPIDWPENNENVLVYLTAGRLIAKGGAELQASATFARIGDEERADMLDEIRRRTINPTRMAYPDTASDWGG